MWTERVNSVGFIFAPLPGPCQAAKLDGGREAVAIGRGAARAERPPRRGAATYGVANLASEGPT